MTAVAEAEQKQAAGAASDMTDTSTGDVVATHDFEFFETWTALRNGSQTFIPHSAPGDIQVSQSVAGTKKCCSRTRKGNS